MTTNTIVDGGKKMRKRLIATLIILLVCVSIVSVQAYTNKEHNFSIDPPSGWDIDDTTGMQIGHSMVDMQWQNGKRVIVWPLEAATAKPIYPKPKF